MTSPLSNGPRARIAPETIGPYQIQRLLGQGGMGAVYLAEQENPRRLVALKVLRGDALSPEALKRFANEAHVLARLQHPGIAQIYSAGTFETAHGIQPYFAMEFIEGETLDQYARAHALSVRERLEMIARICDAVQHAHQRGVIHRDLKPANILVDAQGQTKILDFGVARVTDADMQVTTMITEAGRIVGTLAYMSPEQVGEFDVDIDTRSDVYALGVVAYEILSGELPYALRGMPVWEAIDVIRNKEPSRLSTTSRLFRGDLETIVQKALAKDRDQRYASAGELALDIRRYLDEKPILARPPSAVYTLRKFAARNRVLVGGVAGVFLAVVTGLVISTKMYFKAEDARGVAVVQKTAAERAVARTKAIDEFLLQRMLSAASPFRHGADVRVVDVLDQASSEVSMAFAKEPDLEVEVRQAIGTSYLQLGKLSEAERELTRVLDMGRTLRADDSRETIEAQLRLASVYSRSGQTERAFELASNTLETAQRALGGDDPLTLELAMSRAQGFGRNGDPKRAVDILTELSATAEHTLGPDHKITLEIRGSNSNFLVFLDRTDEAIAISKDVLERALRTQGDTSPAVIDSRSILAMAYIARGQDDVAESYLNQAIEGSIRRNGEDHTATAGLRNMLANVLAQRDDLDRAEEEMRKAYHAFQASAGPEHVDTLTVANDLASLLLRSRRFEEAQRILSEILAIRRKTPEDAAHLGATLNRVGDLLRIRSEPELAIATYREAEELTERSLGPKSAQITLALVGIGRCHVDLGQDALAVPYFARSVAILEELLAPEADDLLQTRHRLAESLLRTQRPAEALDAMCPGEMALAERPDEERARNLNCLLVHAACQKDLGRLAEAETSLVEARDLSVRVFGKGSRQARDCWSALASLYDAWGKPDKADNARAKPARPVEAGAPR